MTGCRQTLATSYRPSKRIGKQDQHSPKRQLNAACRRGTLMSNRGLLKLAADRDKIVQGTFRLAEGTGLRKVPIQMFNCAHGVAVVAEFAVATF